MSESSFMQAAIVTEQQIGLVEQPRPIPTSTQVLIEIYAAGVNRADLLQVRGHYTPPAGESEILGLECSGVVVQCGAAVTQLAVGDRVMALLGSGGCAEYVAVDAGLVVKIPEAVDFITAAVTPETYLAAHACVVELAELQQDERILIHAAGSGVGIAMQQMAKLLGAKIVIAGVGSEWKRERCLQLGANAVVSSRSDHLLEEIHSITDSVDVVFDFIGARYLLDHLELLSEQGRLIEVATMGGAQANINLLPILQKRLQIKGFVLRRQSIREKSQLLHRFIEKWQQQLWQPQLTPVIDKVFAWPDIVSAHEYIRANKNFGKVALVIKN